MRSFDVTRPPARPPVRADVRRGAARRGATQCVTRPRRTGRSRDTRACRELSSASALSHNFVPSALRRCAAHAALGGRTRIRTHARVAARSHRSLCVNRTRYAWMQRDTIGRRFAKHKDFVRTRLSSNRVAVVFFF